MTASPHPVWAEINARETLDAEAAAIEAKATEFLDLLTSKFGRDPAGRCPSRELSLAQTKIEEAVMWAKRHLVG